MGPEIGDFLAAGGLVLVDNVLKRVVLGVAGSEAVLECVAPGVVLGELGLGGMKCALDLLSVLFSEMGFGQRLLVSWGHVGEK